MIPEWPRFNDAFQQALADAFGRRRKAIAKQGKFVFEEAPVAGSSVLVARISVYSRRSLILEVSTENRGAVYVRSTAGRDRGKVLFRREGVRLVGNAHAIVDAFEASILAVCTQPDVFEESLDKSWGRVVLRAESS